MADFLDSTPPNDGGSENTWGAENTALWQDVHAKAFNKEATTTQTISATTNFVGDMEISNLISASGSGISSNGTGNTLVKYGVNGLLTAGIGGFYSGGAGSVSSNTIRTDNSSALSIRKASNVSVFNIDSINDGLKSWTPSFLSGSYTLSISNVFYYKIDKIVHFSSIITIDAITTPGSGSVSISLPLSSAPNTNFCTINTRLSNVTLPGDFVESASIISGTSIILTYTASSGASGSLQYSALNTGSQIIVSGWYIVN